MLLEKALKAHGGKNFWNKLSSISMEFEVKGNILATRLKPPKTWSLRLEVDTRKVCCKLSPFPKKGERGIFTNEYIQIETDSGKILLKKDLEELFNGKSRLPLIWEDFHILYFFGYAFWNYVMTPYFFTWPGFEIEEIGTWQEKNGQIWDKLAVTFPKNIPTHCKKQVFYFNKEGLLCRLDYTAEIFGSFARGAHYCWEYKEFDGLIVPTRRKVFWRLPSGHPLKPFGVMEGWVRQVKVNFA
jgi:hypothetical protein